MKNIVLILSLVSLLTSCQDKKSIEENNLIEIQAQSKEYLKNRIDFFQDATPKYFSAQTISGKKFSSEDFKGKNLVIFIYDETFLKKRETSSYDMQDDFNTLYVNYKDNVNFIGILQGFLESEQDLEHILKDVHFKFDQIDNTESYNKEKKIKYNIFCTPAKILIDVCGKINISSCGGAVNDELIRKLDSIKIST